MIRILLIPSSDYLGHPFPQRHNHLFERIHDGKEFEVHIIRFSIFEKPRLTSKCIIHKIPLELRIRSTALYYLSNVMNYTNEIVRIVKRESIDIVVAGNLLPSLTYLLAQKLIERKIPFIFDLQDYYPTSATGYITNVNSFLGIILRGFFETMTQYIIKNAELVIVPGVALALYARKVGAKKVQIIPNGISEIFLRVHNGAEVRRKLGIGDEDVVVGYIGSVEFWLDMEPLIKAVAKTCERRLPVKLLIIGRHLQTGYSFKLRNWIERYGIEDATIWLDFIPHEEVPRYIAAMDLGTIPFDVVNPTAYYAAPNKLWEYISQGTAVTATPIPEVLVYKDLVNIVRSTDDYISIITRSRANNQRSYLITKARKSIVDRTWSQSTNTLRRLLLDVVSKYRRLS